MVVLIFSFLATEIQVVDSFVQTEGRDLLSLIRVTQ